MKDNLEPTWDDVEGFVDALSRETPPVKGVYGPPRGGLVFAVMLSHRMGIPVLMAPCDGCIIVDDICDSGKTLQHYRETLNCTIATMYYVQGASVMPDFWMLEKSRGEWVTFPWEVENG